MAALDEQLAHLASGGGIAVALAVALLAGLRHAADPDHLSAVSTLVASRAPEGAKRAAALGLAWGLGHATTLCALGLPVVLAGSVLPTGLHEAAEIAVGVVIVGLGLRLLLRRRSRPPDGSVRSKPAAFGVGLLHGVGGSASMGILLVGAVTGGAWAAAALFAFAAGSALSMALASAALGLSLSRGALARRLPALTPALGLGAVAFGTWYAAGPLGA